MKHTLTQTHALINVRFFLIFLFKQKKKKTQKEEQPSLSQLSLHHFIIISRNGWSPQVGASTAGFK